MTSPDLPITCFGPDFPFDYPAWITHPAGIAEMPESSRGAEVAVVVPVSPGSSLPTS